MAENLELRHSEFSQRLCDMTGCSMEDAKKEVDTTIQRLFYWGAYADKYGGPVQVSLMCNGPGAPKRSFPWLLSVLGTVS